MILVKLTATDNSFIECGSNAMYLLNKQGFTFAGYDLSNIVIRNINLAGADLQSTILNGSVFQNLNMIGCNLQCAELMNVLWIDISTHELKLLFGH